MLSLYVASTGSKGNMYVLRTDRESLLLDCGVPVKKTLPHINGSVSGCLVTHEHKDHSAGVNGAIKMGINVYSTKGTLNLICKPGDVFSHEIRYGELFHAGGFSVIPFQAMHDCVEPCGFFIRFDETGETVVYATDTYYLHHLFPNATYWIIECNYCDDLIDKEDCMDAREIELWCRLKESHMSLDRLKKTLGANNMAGTRKIVLIHMSDERSDEKRMVEEIGALTGVPTVAAHDGDRIELF